MKPKLIGFGAIEFREGQGERLYIDPPLGVIICTPAFENDASELARITKLEVKTGKFKLG